MRYKRVIEDDTLDYVSYPTGIYLEHNIPIIRRMAQIIGEEFKGEIINLLCMGSSGAIISAIISSQISINSIIQIRKEGEFSHSVPLSFSLTIPGEKNIIVDDFMSTGQTLSKIYRTFLTEKRIISIDAKVDAIVVSGSIRPSRIRGLNDAEEDEVDLLIARKIVNI